MEWYHQVKAGDVVSPSPAWNQSERPPNRLAPEVDVLDVRTAISQTGVLFKVKSISGQESWLDAGWFTGKVQLQGAFEM